MPATPFKNKEHIDFIQEKINEGYSAAAIYPLFVRMFGKLWTEITFDYKVKMSVSAGKIQRMGQPTIFKNDDPVIQDNKSEIITHRDKKLVNLTSSRITKESQFREWLWERLDKNNWEIKALKVNYYEGQQKHKKIDEAGKEYNIPEVIPMYSFKAEVVPKDNIFDPERFFEKLGKDLAVLVKIQDKKPVTRVSKKRDLLLEPFITDHHLGNVIHDDLYDTIYDIEKAEKYYDQIIEATLSRVDVDRLEEIWLPTGNDLIHADNGSLTTTKGTQLYGENYERAVIVAEAMIIRNIEKLKKTGVKKITVPIVRGNHDWNTIFHLGRSLIHVYKNDPIVQIVASRKHRIYCQFYQVGIGFSHGHYESPNDMDRYFANEAPEIWNATQTRQFHIGDKHHFRKTNDWLRVEENLRLKGIDIIRGSTVCYPDQWHENKGFIGNNHRSQYLVFDRSHHLDVGYVVV